MKNIKYFAWILLFVLSSCYVYKPFSEAEEETTEKVADQRSSKTEASNLADGKQSPEMEARIKEKEEAKKQEAEKKRQEEETKRTEQDRGRTTSNPNMSFTRSSGEGGDLSRGKGGKEQTTKRAMGEGVKAKLEPNKYYKISVEEKQYKIQVDKWEGDTLRAHVIRQPKKELSFHENQIDEETLLERRFSKPYSDIFTVGAYVVGGAAVLLLFL